MPKTGYYFNANDESSNGKQQRLEDFDRSEIEKSPTLTSILSAG